MEKLADLPVPALVTLGFVLALIIGIRYLGLWQGERALPAASSSSAQVAAVIVDPAALHEATTAVREHTKVLDRLTDVSETATKHLGHVATELDRIREELRIQREISRR